MTDLRHLAVRYRLGLQDSESLVRIADMLLEEKCYTPAVIELSILESPVMSEAGPLFERVCLELGITVPTKDEAVYELLRYHLETIVAGTCKPRAGLEAVMREIYFPHLAAEVCKEYVGDSRGLQHLIGAFWSYDELMERPAEVSWDGKYGAEAIARWEEFVRQHARGWLQKYDRVA